jgi:hypothetical protein
LTPQKKPEKFWRYSCVPLHCSFTKIMPTWLDMMLAELSRSGAMQELDGVLHDS